MDVPIVWGSRTVKAVLSRLTSSAIDLLFPLHCAGCRREGKLLCAACVDELPRLLPPYCNWCASPGTRSPCRECGQSPLAVDVIRAPFLMKGAIREAVHSLKYRGVRAAAPELGRLLAQYLAVRPVPGGVLVPVPLHPRRLRNRGYNQSALLAQELAKLSGLALEEGLLARITNAPPQTGAASRSQRRANVAGGFRCSGEARGKRVVLVDVATTGSTLSACAAALKAAGAASVWGLVLAREG